MANVGRPFYLFIENNKDIFQLVELSKTAPIPSGVIASCTFPPMAYKQFWEDIRCVIGLVRVESSVPLGNTGKSFLNYTNVEKEQDDIYYTISDGRNFKEDTNIWEYDSNIMLDGSSKLSFTIHPKSTVKIMLYPAERITEGKLRQRHIKGFAKPHVGFF